MSLYFHYKGLCFVLDYFQGFVRFLQTEHYFFSFYKGYFKFISSLCEHACMRAQVYVCP